MEIILIDANALIHRLYHALPPLTDSQGRPAGATYGLASILIKIIRERRPQYIAAFFDRPEPTFRKEMFEEYKIHRPKAPDDLVSQIIQARGLFEQFRIRTFEVPCFEADDLIGTCVHKLDHSKGVKIIILTGDLDILQLVKGDEVVVETIKKGVSETIIYNEEAVKNRYGVLPKELPDYKGLVGDPSDNIPGVPGIGPKTASLIIQKYGSLERFLEEGQSEKSYEKISSFKEQAILSGQLAVIRRDAPLPIDNLEPLKYEGLPKEDLTVYFDKLGFKSLSKRIEQIS